MAKNLKGKDGLYSYFENKKVVLPKKSSLKLETLVHWFVSTDALNLRNILLNFYLILIIF